MSGARAARDPSPAVLIRAAALGLLLAACDRNAPRAARCPCEGQNTPPPMSALGVTPSSDPHGKSASPEPTGSQAAGRGSEGVPSAGPGVAGPRAPAPWPPAHPQGFETPWCGEVVLPLDEATCVVWPETPSSTLLIYLHGIVPPSQRSPQLDNLQKVVANASRRAGVVALIPRGARGLAPPGHPGWWGWPTSVVAYERHAVQLIAGLEGAQARLEGVVGSPFEQRYLAGSSAGAYFVALLALRGDFAANGYAVLSGGAAPATSAQELAGIEPAPVYVGFGVQDPSSRSAQALGSLLQKAGWPVRSAPHQVGHGAREIYLDEAFAFWAEPQGAP